LELPVRPCKQTKFPAVQGRVDKAVVAWRKKTHERARPLPARTVSSSLFFTPSGVTPRIDLSALGLSECRISIILEQLIALAFGVRSLAGVYYRPAEIAGNLTGAGAALRQFFDFD
jgi:hypothetical protein